MAKLEDYEIEQQFKDYLDDCDEMLTDCTCSDKDGE